MEVIVLDNEVDESIIRSWDSFVNSHPQGNIFQTFNYFNLFRDLKGFHPVAVLLIDDTSNVEAVLSGIIQYQIKGPFRSYASRCIVMGGPLFQNNKLSLLKKILEAFDNFIKNKAIYTQVRILSELQYAKSVFNDLQYNFEDHLNIKVDLTSTKEVLWSEVQPQKRNQINKAIRLGLEMRIISSADDLQKSYNLLKAIYKDIGLPLLPFSIFERMFNELVIKGLAQFFGVYHKEELIGARYAFIFKGTIYDYYAGSDKNYYKIYPNSFLPWQVMMWGKSNGMTLFDWGGAGKPGVPYGVRDYKAKFGGQFVNFGRYEKIHKPILYQLAKGAFELFRYLK